MLSYLFGKTEEDRMEESCQTVSEGIDSSQIAKRELVFRISVVTGIVRKRRTEVCSDSEIYLVNITNRI